MTCGGCRRSSSWPPVRLSTLERAWLIVLRAYLIVAGGLVLIRIVTLAVGALN